MSYPMDDKSRQAQSSYMPSAPPGYGETSVKQPPGGNIQPHVIPYNNAHVQQPTGHSVVVIPPQGLPGYYVSNYMGLSIFSCIFCCWPIGIAAIVMSCLVGSSRREGDLEGAKTYSRWAKYLSIAAIICGMILITIVIVLRVTAGSSTDSKTTYTYNSNN